MLFKEVCEETAKELNLPVYVVEKAMRHWFKFTKETMVSGEMKGIMMPNLGKWLVKPSRIKLLENGKTKNIQNDESCSDTE